MKPDITIRLLGPADKHLLLNASKDLFDNEVDPNSTSVFLDDPRHHILAALDGEAIAGYVSGVHYLHPDKPLEMFINEVAVATAYQRQGIARRLIDDFLQYAKTLGCVQAWVATGPTNTAAQQLYASCGGVPDNEAFIMYDFDLSEK